MDLKLYKDNQEAGNGAYPVRREDPHVGMEWWNALPETQCAHWLMMASSAVPTAARHAYLLVEAYNEAMREVSPGRPEPPQRPRVKAFDDNTTYHRRV